MTDVVAKRFTTINQVFEIGAEIGPDPMLLPAPLTYDVLKDGGFITTQTVMVNGLADIPPTDPGP